MRAITGIWRRRHNPLRRPTTDRLGGLAGAGGRAAHRRRGARHRLVHRPGRARRALLTTVRLQHRQGHPVWAMVDRPAATTPVDPAPETSPPYDGRLRVVAHWTGSDGRPRTGEVVAPRPLETGTRFRPWTDGRGRAVPRPMDESSAGAHAALAGLGAAAAAGGLVEAGRRLAVRRLTAHRFRRRDAAWERAGRDWGRADAGS